MLPEIRAVLGVDVIASANNPGYHRARLWGALSAMLTTALTNSDIAPDEVVHFEPSGDGALYTFPSRHLGTVLDMSERLDKLVADHNRYQKPDIRLRISVDLGAVGEEPGYHSTKISLTRLLSADEFKALIDKCIDENLDQYGTSLVNSGLVVSRSAFREVFGGDHTSRIRQADFIELPMSSKEFAEQAWLRVPGLDTHTLTAFAHQVKNSLAESVRDPHSESTETRPIHVNNQVHGNMSRSVQAGIINGDISWDGQR